MAKSVEKRVSKYISRAKDSVAFSLAIELTASASVLTVAAIDVVPQL